MASLKELRGRIRSVKNTQQITKTMKMVAAAKVRKAREACEKARPYAEKLYDVTANLAASIDCANKTTAPPLLAGRAQVKTVRLLVFGSDRGLCGGLNGAVAKTALKLVDDWEQEGKQVQIITLGRKPKDLLRTLHGDKIIQTNDGMTADISFETARRVASETRTAFEKGECDQVFMLFNTFVSMMRQQPTPLQLIPFAVEEKEGHTPVSGAKGSIEYEPEEEAILNELLPTNLATQVYRAMLEGNASEQAARMMAMDSATRNAGDMIKSLSLTYNRSRQATITKELIEIISGAEAV